MMIVMSLDAKNTPIAVEITAVGGIDNCVLDVRNIFKYAVISNASNIICFHNHPSGIPESSEDDKAITRRIKEAGNLLGIPLLDHIIIGQSYCSLKEKGYL
jgi:DNA repair protein RadC